MDFDHFKMAQKLLSLSSRSPKAIFWTHIRQLCNKTIWLSHFVHFRSSWHQSRLADHQPKKVSRGDKNGTHRYLSKSEETTETKHLSYNEDRSSYKSMYVNKTSVEMERTVGFKNDGSNR